jgi:DNA-binding NarL/FixJ family response regulator
MGRPRILLADEHALFMDVFRKLLEPEFEVVGTAADGPALLAAALQWQPDLIVADIGLPLLQGTDAVRKFRKLLPKMRLLIVAMNDDPSSAADAVREWAAGFLLRQTGGPELVYAIQELITGKMLVAQKMSPPALSGDKALTHRQREVLQLLAGGMTMKETATTLKLTPRTVAFHKYKIMEDFGLHSNLDLLKLAIREHLVPPA